MSKFKVWTETVQKGAWNRIKLSLLKFVQQYQLQA